MLQAFDELLLLKRGGTTTYYGNLGADSCDLIAYLEVSAEHHECLLWPVYRSQLLQLLASLLLPMHPLLNASAELPLVPLIGPAPHGS